MSPFQALVCFLSCFAVACGCHSRPIPAGAVADETSEGAIAHFVAMPVSIDGRLREPHWEAANWIPLHTPGNEAGSSELGRTKIAWDDRFIYVGVQMVDRDVVQENSQSQQHHYLTGDVVEVFVQSTTSSGYWEIYATPQGVHTSFYFPSAGRAGLPSSLQELKGLQTASRVEGTLNDWRDDDVGWTAELAIPIEVLDLTPEAVRDGFVTSVLIARYNYGRQLEQRELTSAPRMPRPAWHVPALWGKVRFAR